MIVGYRISNDLCTESCISTLEDAILTYGSPQILNSDQGSQFTSEAWINTAQHYNINLSQTGKGRCIDNIYIERLWRSFKYEGSYLYQWDTVYSLKTNIGKWVRWYNYDRPHQSLNYSTTAETLFKAYSSNNSNVSVAKFNIVQEVNM
jgi:putative transposase